MAFRNLAREYSTTTGTSDAVLTGAVPGCLTWELAGVQNSEAVRYGIITYNTTTRIAEHSEVGLGTYTTADNTLARTTVISSTNGGSKITLTGRSEVYICPIDLDFQPFAVMKKATSQTINDTVTATVQIDTVQTNLHSIVSLASNTITFLYAGWYELNAIIHAEAGAAFDVSYIMLLTNNSSSSAADLNMRYPTNAAFQANEMHFRQTMLMAANDTLLIGLENQTGQTLTVVALEVAVTLKART
jgi:hypothetical protein